MPSDQNTKKMLVVQKCGHSLWLLSTSYQYNHKNTTPQRTRHPSPCSFTQYPHDKEHHNNKVAKIKDHVIPKSTWKIKMAQKSTVQ